MDYDYLVLLSEILRDAELISEESTNKEHVDRE